MKYVFATLLCLCLFSTIKADPILITSGTVTTGAGGSSQVGYSLQGLNFSFSGATLSSYGGGSGIGFGFPGTRSFFSSLSGWDIGKDYPQFGTGVLRFTVNGQEYYLGGGSWQFSGSVLIPVVEQAELSTITSTFDFVGSLSGYPVSNPIPSELTIFTFTGQGIASFQAQTFLLSGQWHTDQVSGPQMISYTFTTPTPEPASLLLFLTAIPLLARRLRSSRCGRP